jgi:hypothetical protein
MNESRKIEQLTGTESTLREILPPSSVEEVGGESSLNESVTPALSVDKDAVSQTPPPVLEEVTSISSGYLLTSNTAEESGQSSIARRALSQKISNQLPAN